MNSYEKLLMELLWQLNQKADRLISLFEVRQDAEHGGHDSADPGDGSQDGPHG